MKMEAPLPDLAACALHDYRVLYRNLKTSIINEVSLVSYIISRFINQRIKLFMGNKEPFRNSNILYFGDFRLLAPVVDTPVNHTTRNQGMDNLLRNLLWEHFKLHELFEISVKKTV